MRRAALPLLLLALSGCLTQPAPSAPSAPPVVFEPTVPLPDDLLPPVPTLLPPPVTPPTQPLPARALDLPGTRLVRATPSEGASVTFEVDDAAARLTFGIATNGTLSAGSVALFAPDASLAGECRESGCVVEVDASAGTWSILFPPESPADLVAAVHAQAREAAHEATQHLLYERSKDMRDVFHVPVDNDTMPVPMRYARLVAKVHATQPAPGAQLAFVRLLDPSGAQRGACDAVEPLCTMEVAEPAPGLWRIQYDGAADARLDVTGYGLDVPPRELPARFAVYGTDHAWPASAPFNRSAGFYAPAGFGRILLDVAFHDLDASRGVPFMLLRAPNGTNMAMCGADEAPCSFEIEAAPGIWRVLHLGAAAGWARIDATVDASPLAPPAPALSPPELVLMKSYGFAGLTNRTEWLNLFSGTRLRGNITLNVEPDASGWTPAVDIWEPDGGQHVRCTSSCEVDVSVGVSGRWMVMVNGKGNGTASISLFVHEEVPGAFVRSGDGHTFVGYNNTHAYWTWGASRGDFAEGMHVPGNWTTLRFELEFVRVAADDPSATAVMEVRDPYGALVLTCALPKRFCDGVVPSQRGLWEIGFRGVDASSYGRVVAVVT